MMMKTYIDTTLPCAVLGHNYIKLKDNHDLTAKLTCKNCGVVINTDTEGNFEHIHNPKSHIQTTLRKLYHLKLQLLKKRSYA